MFGAIEESVFPSGVSFSFSEMTTKNQNDLIEASRKGSAYIYEDIFYDRLETIGNLKKGDFDLGFVRKQLLDSDLKFGLLKMRNFSFRDEKDFTFSVDFPMDKKDKKKITETKTVDLSSFSVKPYKWVRDYMDNLYKDDQETKIALCEKHEFPVMYDSYQSMLDENLSQKMTIGSEDDNKKLKYKLLTGEAKLLGRTRYKDVDDYYKALYIRESKMKIKSDTADEKKDVWQQVPWEKFPARITDQYQKHFFDIEANVDTSAEIRSEENPLKTVRVDFLQMGEFFSPSLAV